MELTSLHMHITIACSRTRQSRAADARRYVQKNTSSSTFLGKTGSLYRMTLFMQFPISLILRP